MTHKERFRATIERKPVDRPASWLGISCSLKPNENDQLAKSGLKSSLKGKRLKLELAGEFRATVISLHHS